MDLDSLIGPRCSDDISEKACCYEPLGYDGGPTFGTGCREACGTYDRVGDDNEYCQQSGQNKDKYGNWCAPSPPSSPPASPLSHPLCNHVDSRPNPPPPRQLLRASRPLP